MFGVAIMTSIAAHIQEWPTAYQMMNVPHFLMYIAIVFYLCQKEFYTAAWAVFALITLVTVDFIILSKKIFAMERIMVNRLKGKNLIKKRREGGCNCNGGCQCQGQRPM